MAEFTIELGRLLESGYDIGLKNTDYPIYDEQYRAILNKYIIDHFEFREIGQETPALFKKFLNRKMREIMPYYNKMYESALIEFNPLFSQDLTSDATTNTHHSAASTESTAADSVNDATGRTVVSSTPQTQLTGNEDYASGLTDSVSEGKNVTTGQSESTGETDGLTTYAYNVAGYTGQNPSEAIMRYRMSLINVNMMILNELETLFMGIWNPQVGGM